MMVDDFIEFALFIYRKHILHINTVQISRDHDVTGSINSDVTDRNILQEQVAKLLRHFEMYKMPH